MLKKMRWRLIAAAMAAFFAVIALIAVLVNVVNYYVVTDNADQTLSSLMSFESRADRAPPPRDENDGGPGKRDGGPPAPITEFPDVEANYMTRFFFVRFDAEGEVTSTSTDFIASVDETDAVQYAQQALSRKSLAQYVRTALDLCALPPRTHNPSLVMRKYQTSPTEGETTCPGLPQ